jgi:small subunit ribosomal protein S7e
MASHKIAKPAGAAPADEVELSVAQALVDLENNVAELKKELRPLQISSAKEVCIVPVNFTVLREHH